MMPEDIIIEPIITEKSNDGLQEGKYTFKVNKKATKIEIKDAVEKTFGVKVESINTLITKPKAKRVGKYAGQRKTYKKAIITLCDGSKIEM